MTKNLIKRAMQMFNAYNEEGPTPWKTFDGRDVPRWEGLNDAVRAKWVAAARTQNDESADVLEFMRKFGQTFKRGEPHEDRSLNEELPFEPRMLTRRKLRERFRFMREELREFNAAIRTLEMDDLADALVDLVYVAKGTANLLGLPWSKLWEDVHRANMAKVRGIGARGNLVDCIKPPGWAPPMTGLIIAKALNGEPLSAAQWDDPEHAPGGEMTASDLGLRFDPEQTRGLNEKKFITFRADGTSQFGEKHHGCDYFVLDLKHDKFAKEAMLSYADECEGEFPHLADDLRAKATKP